MQPTHHHQNCHRHKPPQHCHHRNTPTSVAPLTQHHLHYRLILSHHDNRLLHHRPPSLLSLSLFKNPNF
ncbi:hypothetical protein Hanom_Chr03g00183371 [Helianthus anomalus]